MLVNKRNKKKTLCQNVSSLLSAATLPSFDFFNEPIYVTPPSSSLNSSSSSLPVNVKRNSTRLDTIVGCVNEYFNQKFNSSASSSSLSDLQSVQTKSKRRHLENRSFRIYSDDNENMFVFAKDHQNENEKQQQQEQDLNFILQHSSWHDLSMKKNDEEDLVSATDELFLYLNNEEEEEERLNELSIATLVPSFNLDNDASINFDEWSTPSLERCHSMTIPTFDSFLTLTNSSNRTVSTKSMQTNVNRSRRIRRERANSNATFRDVRVQDEATTTTTMRRRSMELNTRRISLIHNFKFSSKSEEVYVYLCC